MEARCFLSGFCSNSFTPSLRDLRHHSLLQLPSSSSTPLQSPTWPSSNTLHSLAARFPGLKQRFLCINSVGKVEGLSSEEDGIGNGIRRKNLAVFVSGGGSNFRSIHEGTLRGSVHGDIVVLVTDKPGCGGATYAKDNDIPVILFPKTKIHPEGLSTDELITTLGRYNVDFILLAGYLKLIPVELIRAYPRSVLNIHPSLLPAFGGKGYYGMKVHKAVVASGARYSGPTIHIVNEEYDTGRIIAQRVVPVLAKDTAEELAARVLHEEHQLYVEVAAALCEERIVWREDGVPLIQSKDNPVEYT